MTTERRRLTHLPASRLTATYVLLGALLIVFAGRLYQLQVIEGLSYAAVADDNRFDTVSLPAPRRYLRPQQLPARSEYPGLRRHGHAGAAARSGAQVEAILLRLSDLTGVPIDDRPGGGSMRPRPRHPAAGDRVVTPTVRMTPGRSPATSIWKQRIVMQQVSICRASRWRHTGATTRRAS
jgi:hypothetical protein